MSGNIQQGRYLMRNTLLFATFTLLLSCGNPQNSSSTNQPLLREKIGRSALDAIASAQFVEVEEIEPVKDRGGFAFTGFGRVLHPDKTEELKKLILNDQSFDFEKMKSCLFVPKTAFHFKNQHEDLVTILYSPWCKQIKIIDRDSESVLEADAIADSIDRILKR